MLTFLLDECDPKGIADAIRHWNEDHPDQPIDFVTVGEPADLPTGTPDPDILRWAERAGRIVVTIDYSTMPGHLVDHLAAGRHSPGVLSIRRGATIPKIVEALAIIAHAGDPAEFADALRYIPL